MNDSRNHTLKITSWNIQGLKTRLKPTNQSLSSCKLNIKSVHKNLAQYDVIFLQETWLKEDNLTFPGYNVHNSFKTSSCIHGQGGVSILVKNELKDNIVHFASKSSNILWCKISHNHFGLTKDIFIANVYISPLQSQKKNNEDDLLILENEIDKFSNLGEVILLGDFNARTGILNDFVENDSSGEFLNHENPVYETDNLFPTRNNSDLKLNTLGNELLQLCISNKFRILNGRKTGDLTGKFTSYQSMGVSTIDYGIIAENLWNQILSFEVLSLTPYSDHCPISISLKTYHQLKLKKNKSKKKTASEKNKFSRFIWNNDSEEKFKLALNQVNIKDMISQFLKNPFESPEDEVECFNKIITETAKLSLKRKKETNRRKNCTKHHKKWYDINCTNLKKKLQNLAKELNRSNSFQNKELRKEYFTIKKQYKKLVKQKHREYKNTIFNDIRKLDPKYRNDFWKHLQDLRREKSKQNLNISTEEWVNHFKNLLYDQQDNQPIENSDNLEETYDQILDSEFTEKEIHERISSLKKNKAPGIDGILNEMLKYGRFYLVPMLTKLFNNVLDKGIFPSQWNVGLIKPIYKNKGDPSLPGNYRGITLASSLGKLFTSIMQIRYSHFLEINSKLNPEQFGFRKNSRTTDSLFVLKQLLNKYLVKKDKIFACFIDYHKAFDTVWHKGLLTKIRNIGVQGKFFNVVNSMYENITTHVKTNQNTFSDIFSCNKGIMQGDSLSPVLFTSFMNDLPEYLKQHNCPGLTLQNLAINCLMFADDLILLSSSAEGLQKSINAVSSHAKSWKLKINKDKSNVMIFSSNGHILKNYAFSLDNEPMEIVDKQTYLGLALTPSGKFTYARSILSKKAKKTIAYIRVMLSNCTNVPLDLLTKLFDALVKPVLLYGCEIWGPELLSYKTDFDKSTIEQTHIKFCKQVLNVPFYTSNMKCRAELGRFPLSIDIKKHIASYYYRLQHNITNPLLKGAYQYIMSHDTDFINIVKNVKEIKNHQPVTEPITKYHIRIASKKVEKDLKTSSKNVLFQSLALESLNKPNRLTYGHLKKDYCIEKYLQLTKVPSNRIIISKFRLNAHKLRSNTGCYENKGQPIPYENRTCYYCKSTSIEDEKHFILECNQFNGSRAALYSEIAKASSTFSHLSLQEKLHFMLNSQNEQIINMVGKYLHKIYTERVKLKT